MDKKTLTALRGSIKKWERIVAGEGVDDGTNNCPLCAEFYEDYCAGCPVHAATGRSGCGESPYEVWTDIHMDADRLDGPLFVHDDDSAIAAVLELEFLKSLLPEKTK